MSKKDGLYLWDRMTPWERINHFVGVMCGGIVGYQLGAHWIPAFFDHIQWK